MNKKEDEESLIFSGLITWNEQKIIHQHYPLIRISTYPSPRSKHETTFTNHQDNEEYCIFSGSISNAEYKFIALSNQSNDSLLPYTSSVILIQSTYRKYARLKLMHASAKKIIHFYKLNLVVKRLGYLDQFNRDDRGWSLCSTQNTYFKLLKTVVLMQSKRRMIQIVCSFKRLKSITIQVQSTWKMKVQKRVFLAKMKSILKIQSTWRMMVQKKGYLKLIGSIITIQSTWRMFVQRRIYLAMIQSISKIQSTWRMFVQRRIYLGMTGSIVEIQSMWRMFVQRRIYLGMTGSIIKIQSMWRMFVQRRIYLGMTGSIIKIQSNIRRYLIHRRHKRILNAAIMMKKCWKSYKNRYPERVEWNICGMKENSRINAESMIQNPIIHDLSKENKIQEMSLDQKRQMLVDIRIKKSLLEAKIEGSKHESPIKKSILPIPTITRIPQHARRSNLPLPNYSTPNSPALTRFKQLSPPRSIKSHIFKQPSMLTSKSAPFQVIQEDRRLIALTLNNTRLNKDRKCQIVYQVIRKQGSRPDSPIKPKRSIDYNSFDDLPVQGCNLKWNTVVDCREYEVLEAFNENEEKHIINIDTTLEPLVKRQRISSLDERFNSIFRGKRILKGCLKKEPQSFRLEFGEVELKRVIVPVRRVVYSDDPVHH